MQTNRHTDKDSQRQIQKQTDRLTAKERQTEARRDRPPEETQRETHTLRKKKQNK